MNVTMKIGKVTVEMTRADGTRKRVVVPEFITRSTVTMDALQRRESGIAPPITDDDATASVKARRSRKSSRRR
jgi:hypothetical protein